MIWANAGKILKGAITKYLQNIALDGLWFDYDFSQDIS